MISNEESTIDLIKKLIEHTIIEIKPNILPSGRKNISYFKLKSTIYNILFTNQNHDNSLHQNGKLSEFEQLSWMTYILSQKHEYDKAHHLSLCIDKLQLIDNLIEHSELTSALKVLLNLARPIEEKSISLLEPWIIAKKDEKWNLPTAPLNYGDTRLHTSSANWFYVHYPAHLFDDHNLSKDVVGTTKRTKFRRSSLDPGSSHARFVGEKSSVKRCLGAMLNHFCAPNPGTVLSIPELPDRKGLEVASVFRSCLPSSAYLYQEQEADEGCASSQCSAVGDLSDIVEIYPIAETEEVPLQTEKKFITESSMEVVERLWRLNHYHWNILSNQKRTPVWNEKCQTDLCKDIMYLIVGVESDSFPWNQKENSFQLKFGLCCKGVTPGAIKGHVEEFIICGNKLRRLEQMCDGNPYKKGLVWTALIRSVKSFIVIYRTKIFSYNGGLLLMKTAFAGLMSKLHFLEETCSHFMQMSRSVPLGLEIINLLLQSMRTALNPSNSYLILSLLNSCCQPFFRFLERWIYCGENYDPFSEFFIESDKVALLLKDSRYWKDGHKLRNSQFDACDPLIRVIMEQAFECGKATSFLADFGVNHSLISGGKGNHPKICFGWASRHVDRASQACHEFSSKVKLASESLNEVLLEQYDDMCKEKEINLLNAAIEQRVRTLKRIKDATFVQKEKIRNRKQMAMEALLKDMREARHHKTVQETAERDLDEKIKSDIKKMEILNSENANKIRMDMMHQYEEYVTESDKKEALLNEKLKMLTLDFTADSKTSNGSSTNKEIKNPKLDQTNGNFIINPDQDNDMSQKNESIFSKSLSYRESDVSRQPSGLPETPLEELSEMSTTPDDIPMVSRDIETWINPSIVEDHRNKNLEENRKNMMKSSIFPTVGIPVGSKLVPKRTTEYIYEDSINHNVLRNELTNVEQVIDTDYVNQNFPLEEIDSVTHQSPTVLKNGIEEPENSEPKDDTSVATGSMDPLTDDSRMATTTSMDSLPASSVAEMRIGTMKKSQSETFARKSTTTERCEKRPKSCLFETSVTSDMPVLRDQDEIYWPRVKGPPEHFSDKDLLSARNLEHTSKLSVASYDLKLCDRIPDLDLGLNDTMASTSSHGDPPRDEDIPTSVNYIIRTISVHVAAQFELANKAILSHLLIDQGLLKDVGILQSVMLTQNASICRSLVANLANKLTPCCNPSSILTPYQLNNALSNALSFSALGQQLADQLFFVVTKVPAAFDSPCDIWDCVQLQYKVKWPNSVIVDTQAMDKYVKIWKLLMKVHHSIYAMDELYRSFLRKRLGMLHNHQVHQLSVMSYEIHNFIRVILSYVSHQAVQISLADFEKSLRNGNLTIDELYEVHSEFLNVVMAKCFLNEKGSLVYNLLIDIFARVHKFCSLLNAYTFQDEHFKSSIFNEAKKISGEFKKMALFLTKLLHKVSVYTRMDHVEAFHLQLNFNQNFKI